MVLSESLKANLLGKDSSSQASQTESQQANVSCKYGSPLRARVIIGLVIVSVILCAVIVLWKSQKKKLTCEKRLEDGTCNVADLFEYNFLLVNNFYTIAYVPFNGETQSLVSTTFHARRIDYDCTEGRFYATSYGTNQIYSANYNGTDEKVFIKEGTGYPQGLAVDWISRRLYWADWDKETIEVVSLENPTVRTVLIYGDVAPLSIAVDPLRSKLYWANMFDNETIEWSNLDGSERQILVRYPQILHARSIKVFTSTGELCYIDRDRYRGSGRIECIDPSSKQIRIIASNLNDARELAITDEMFYWADWRLKTIGRVSSAGVRQKPITIPESQFLTVVTAVTDKCPLLDSPCARNNGDCPENTICLVNSSAPQGRRCVAKKKCIINPQKHKCAQLVLDN